MTLAILSVVALADLPFSMRRSFEWKYPELPDVSTIAIAQEKLDELRRRRVVLAIVAAVSV